MTQTDVIFTLTLWGAAPFLIIFNTPIAQLDRALASEAECSGSNPDRRDLSFAQSIFVILPFAKLKKLSKKITATQVFYIYLPSPNSGSSLDWCDLKNMKTVIQRVKKASVTIDLKEKREISQGLVILAAFGKNDNTETCKRVFEKILKLRIFSNEEGKFDYSVEDIKGALLIISQFTLYGNCGRGKRPDFTGAAPYDLGKKLYEDFLDMAKKSGLKIENGEFGSDMMVEIHNDGPVTIILDSEDL